MIRARLTEATSHDHDGDPVEHVVVPLQRLKVPAGESDDELDRLDPATSISHHGASESAHWDLVGLLRPLRHIRHLSRGHCLAWVRDRWSTWGGTSCDVPRRCCATRSCAGLWGSPSWWPSGASSQQQKPRRQVGASGSRRRRVLRCALTTLVVVLACAVALVLWASMALAVDPLTRLRVRLLVAYPPHEVNEAVALLGAKGGGASPVDDAAAQDDPFFGKAHGIVVRLRLRLEREMLFLLSRALAARSPTAKADAAQLVMALWQSAQQPALPMMGERADVGYQHKLNHSSVAALRTVRVTVERRLGELSRAALLRCTHGVPTLPVPSAAAQSSKSAAPDRVLDALWSAFAGGNAVATVQPQCLGRSQRRMPCADVGVGSGASPPERSRVQHLYEHGRLRVDDAAVAELYYASTPALPAEAREWAKTPLNGSGAAGDAVLRRVRAQEERFRRSAPGVAGTTARPLSGVILFLSGAADRNPKGRANDFMQHALPLLERHMLQRYPHYPVHVFYEAPALPAHPAPSWTLSDVLRHSDVHTVLHSWRGPAGPAVGSGGQLVHVAPPPPVLVDRVELLPAMRAQQAALQDWFGAVASRVPSAPYVTFENIAPLFSTLPCGVSEEDVDYWVRDKRVYLEHRRGYRQMCRFWARLVWRLPSLRVWTDSAEGRAEMAVYGDGGAAAEADESVLPPWRYRYTYYMRLDTDSFLRRPMSCDPFVIMAAQRCAYGYNRRVLDWEQVTMNFGTAIVEWLDSRTSIEESERALVGANESRVLPELGVWGRLSDPALFSTVTLVAAAGAAAEAPVPLPPTPPTWPWHGVHPEHSSAALSASEKDVLRALFFDYPDNSAAKTANEKETKRVREHSAKAPYDPLPGGYARQSRYNLAMYYNNFELGTFALKNHPLYTSLTEFFDNRDYDDVTGPEREAAGIDFTQHQLHVGDAANVSAVASRSTNTTVYSSPVYLLDTVFANPTTGAAAVREVNKRCLGRRDKFVDGADPELLKAARSVERDWRTGYLQYRWGDAPVHSFGVEAVMQREGWGVCAFLESLGGYEHGY